MRITTYTPRAPLPSSALDADELRTDVLRMVAEAPLQQLEYVRAMLAPAPRLISGPSDAAALAHKAIGMADREHMYVIALNGTGRVVGAEVVSVGAIDTTVADARIILRTVLRLGGTAMIVAHNHPSGDATPSPQDETATRTLKRACDAVGILLIDHVIVASSGQFVSMAAMGLVA